MIPVLDGRGTRAVSAMSSKRHRPKRLDHHEHKALEQPED